MKTKKMIQTRTMIMKKKNNRMMPLHMLVLLSHFQRYLMRLKIIKPWMTQIEKWIAL